MDLNFTQEQQELKDAVRRFCSERVSPPRLAAWEQESRGIDERTWNEIGSLGWFGLGLPVAAGGSGLGLVDVACLLQECAHGLIPRCVIDAVRGAWALASIAPDAPELRRIAAGEQSVVLALDEERSRAAEHFAVRYEPGGAGRLEGAKWYVADGMNADMFLVAAREGHGLSLVLAGRQQAQASGLRTFDGDRQAVVRFSGAARRLTAAGHGNEAFKRIRAEQAALALAEMVGGMEAALEMTVQYVKEREQFGQKIAVFQAVQHQVADMGTATSASRHLAWRAITRLANGTEEGSELSAALAFAGQAFKRVTLTAHHLHGGAGFVVEHPLHYHSERAQSLCIRYAPEPAMLATIAGRLLD